MTPTRGDQETQSRMKRFIYNSHYVTGALLRVAASSGTPGAIVSVGGNFGLADVGSGGQNLMVTVR